MTTTGAVTRRGNRQGPSPATGDVPAGVGRADGQGASVADPPSGGRLLTAEEMPACMRRPFITRGYQCGGTRSQAMLRTLAGFNNETLNAYTMIVGGIVAAYLFWSYRSAYQDICPRPFLISVVATLLHVPLSVGFHCFRTISEADRKWWRTVDALGVIVSVVIRCSVASSFLFTSRNLYLAYLSCVSLTLLAFVAMLLLGGTLKALPKRQQATCIVSVALLASTPLLKESFHELVDHGHVGPATLGTLRMAGLGIAGGGIYALHGPERWFPTVFCYAGCSHQIMHILVMGIPLCELSLMLSLIEQGRKCMG